MKGVTMNKACFLDRDGVLIEEENYLSDSAKVRLCPRVPEALRLLRAAGYKLILTSNQSGIARGYFTVEQLHAVEEKIAVLLADEKAALDGIYYCFHHVSGSVAEYAIDCECRKPRPGMLLRAAQDFDLDLPGSFMIGDKTTDLEAGFNAGCLSGALVRTGHGAEQDLAALPRDCFAVDAPDILSAARALLKHAEENH